LISLPFSEGCRFPKMVRTGGGTAECEVAARDPAICDLAMWWLCSAKWRGPAAGRCHVGLDAGG
jgi:hypothetical protein